MVSLDTDPRLATLFLFVLYVLHKWDCREQLQPLASPEFSAANTAWEHRAVSWVEMWMPSKNVSVAEWPVAGVPLLFLSCHLTCQGSAKAHTEEAILCQQILQEHQSVTDLFASVQVSNFMCVFFLLCVFSSLPCCWVTLVCVTCSSSLLEDLHGLVFKQTIETWLKKNNVMKST